MFYWGKSIDVAILTNIDIYIQQQNQNEDSFIPDDKSWQIHDWKFIDGNLCFWFFWRRPFEPKFFFLVTKSIQMTFVIIANHQMTV